MVVIMMIINNYDGTYYNYYGYANKLLVILLVVRSITFFVIVI